MRSRVVIRMFFVMCVGLLACQAMGERQLTVPIIDASRAKGKQVQCVVSVGPEVGVCSIAFAPGNKVLATAGYKEVVLWDLTDAKLLIREGTTAKARYIQPAAVVAGCP